MMSSTLEEQSRLEPSPRKRKRFGSRTGLTWTGGDERHRHPQRAHPERPERVSECLRYLRTENLVDRCEFVEWPGWDAADSEGDDEALTPNGLDASDPSSVETRKLLDARIESVHSPYYLQRFRAQRMKRLAAADADAALSGGGRGSVFNEESGQYDSVFISAGSGAAAKRAVCASLALADALVQGTISNGLALVRPPGHHAEPCAAKGFCLFNNVGVVARALVDDHGERVLIVDWDVHFGNGTCEMFQTEDNPTYVSIHRHDGGTFFPGAAKHAAASHVGLGQEQGPSKGGGGGGGEERGRQGGKGHTVNVAWRGGGAGDAEYAAAFEQVVLPLARELEPTVVLVSAGFDAACGDPIGGCGVTPEGFALLTRLLCERVPSAKGRVLLFLEGGYRLSILPLCVAGCLEALVASAEAQEKSSSSSSSSSSSAAALVTEKKGEKTRDGDDGVLLERGAGAGAASTAAVTHADGAKEDGGDEGTSPTTVLQLPPSPFVSSDSSSTTSLLSTTSSADGGRKEDNEHCSSSSSSSSDIEDWTEGLLPAAVEAIQATREAHAPFWAAFREVTASCNSL